MCQIESILIRPEVDVQEMRRIGQHVTVQRGDVDALLAQSLKDRRDFFGNQGKVTCNGGSAITGRLKIDGSGDAHRWRDHLVPIRNGFRAGNAILVDPVSSLALIA